MKGKHLSFVARVTLIKFVISTIPLIEIRRVERNFLWGLSHETRKNSLGEIG